MSQLYGRDASAKRRLRYRATSGNATRGDYGENENDSSTVVGES